VNGGHGQVKPILEAALMAADRPLTVEQLLALFDPEDGQTPARELLQQALAELRQDYAGHGIELAEVARGYRFQTRPELSRWVNRLWEERPPRYSRALMETLAIIAYRQPVTRAEVEALRGVGISSSILRTLIEREWVRVAGHREVPGRPAVYVTTPNFLDYFNLKSLAELPPLTQPGSEFDQVEQTLHEEGSVMAEPIES
jgi:segregation and condensation protein B